MNIQSPAVSVIIPVYNVEDYLNECLDSVINQSLKNIEIICINDGSVDHSLSILEMYAENDSRIHIYTQANQGLSSARNLGLQHATGTYIYFLDSDDKIKTTALEVLYNQADSEELDILYFDGELYYENESLQKSSPANKAHFTSTFSIDTIITGLALLEKFISNNSPKIQVSLKLIKKEFLCKNHICFKPGILHEDELFSYETSTLAKRVDLKNESFFQYRIREGSIMTSKKSFASFYGCFMSYIYLMSIMETLNSKQTVTILQKDLNKLLRISINRFQQLSTQEQDNIYTLPELEQSFFQQHILPFCKDFHYLPNQISSLQLAIAAKNHAFLKSSMELQSVYECFSYKVGTLLMCIPEYIKRKTATPITISVIVPIYNKAKWLAECVDSIINQTLHHIEIILIDDGSTDHVDDILANYENNSTIKIIRQENQGVSASRNRAIQLAKGEFVAFMDADDYYPDANVLADLYTAAKIHSVSVVGGSLLRNRNGTIFPSMGGFYFEKDQLLSYSDYQFEYGFYRFIYAKGLLEKYNIQFPLYEIFEDPPFLVNALYCGKKFYALNRFTY